MRPWKVIVAAWLSLLLALGSAPCLALLIPANGRVDMVHDFKRDRIYITAGGSVLRYDVATQAMLSPVSLGGSLQGIDISPDGNRIAVADTSTYGGNMVAHVVDLNTLAVTDFHAPLASYEAGSHSVAFGADGSLLVSTEFNGSGWTPLRKFEPSGTFSTVLGEVRQRTMLAASGDRKRLGFAESNISDGRWGEYDFVTNAFQQFTGYTLGTSWLNYEIAANHDGSQFAIPTYGGTYFYDSAATRLAIVGTYAGPQPVGVAYHPVENLIYLPWEGTAEVKVYETSTFTQVATVPSSESFGFNGNWAYASGRVKLSADGHLLLVGVSNGVDVHPLYAPLAAADVAASTVTAVPVTFPLGGSIGNGGALAWSLVSRPAHGTATLSGRNVTYMPDPGFFGQDQFTYAVRYGGAQVLANAVLTVGPARPLIDFNADHKTDLVWQHQDGSIAVWLMDGTTPIFEGTVFGPVAGTLATKVGDFDGDGKTDFVRQFADGSIRVYLMDGMFVASQAEVMAAATGWLLLDVADFDGDGKADLLLLHADGSTEILLMNGALVRQATIIMPGAIAAGWRVSKVADFNGDARSDLLWTNPSGGIGVWTMNGTTATDKQVMFYNGGGWTVIGTGDFNADGKADVLFLHVPTGAIGMWLMDGTHALAKQSLFSAATGWSVADIADFDADGKADLLWTSIAGDTGVWLMDGLYPTLKQVIMRAGAGWTAAATADLDDDGRYDILWSSPDGAALAWLMDGATPRLGAQLREGGTGWSLATSVLPNH